jgi:DNA repair exonuclease SbcCD ATPase subunit
MATTTEIFNEAEAHRKDLQKAESNSQNEIDAIDRQLHPGTGLSPQRRAELEADKAACRDTIIDLNNEMERFAYVTLARLNDAAELGNIREKVQQVIAGLRRTRDKIARHGQIASNITSALTGLEKIREELEDAGILGGDKGSN